MTHDPNQSPPDPYLPGQPPVAQPYGQPGYVPAYAVQPARPASVTVLAILGIIFGGMGLLCSPLSLIPYFLPPQQRGPNPMIDVVLQDRLLYVWTIGSVVVGAFIALILLVGSIGSLRLRGWARGTMLLYAWLALISIVLNIAYMAIALLPQTMRQAGASSSEVRVGVIGGLVGAVIGSLIGAILPVCVLIFFRKPNVVEAFQRGPNPV